jgi:hypothetical protein
MNQAETIKSYDVCSESAFSNDDSRYYDNDQQFNEQNNSFRYINPITSIIDAISNVFALNIFSNLF